MNAIGYINQSEYEPRFWNMARCRSGQDDRLSTGYNTANGTYALPAAFGKKLEQALSQESLFRGMATVIRAYGNDYTLYAKDTNDLARFVEEGGMIPVYDGIDDFTVSKIGSHMPESMKLILWNWSLTNHRPNWTKVSGTGSGNWSRPKPESASWMILSNGFMRTTWKARSAMNALPE